VWGWRLEVVAWKEAGWWVVEGQLCMMDELAMVPAGARACVVVCV
jgi:hypothetical protein